MFCCVDTTAKICTTPHWQGTLFVPVGTIIGAVATNPSPVAAFFADVVVKSTS